MHGLRHRIWVKVPVLALSEATNFTWSLGLPSWSPLSEDQLRDPSSCSLAAARISTWRSSLRFSYASLQNDSRVVRIKNLVYFWVINASWAFPQQEIILPHLNGLWSCYVSFLLCKSEWKVSERVFFMKQAPHRLIQLLHRFISCYCHAINSIAVFYHKLRKCKLLLLSWFRHRDY